MINLNNDKVYKEYSFIPIFFYILSWKLNFTINTCEKEFKIHIISLT